MAQIPSKPRPPPPQRNVPFAVVSFMLPCSAALIGAPFLYPSSTLPFLSASLGFALLALLLTLTLVPALGPSFLLADLKGKDLLKRATHYIPESIGLIAASVYIALLILFIPFPFSNFLQNDEKKKFVEGLARADFPHQQLAVYLAAILSLLIATLLGFLDDVFDIRWRHKLPIPIIASVPLLMVYFAEGGNTHVIVPKPLRFILGNAVDLGVLYYAYMSLLSTFCTNSINILAGINGLEATQALIIAISVALNDSLYLPWWFNLTVGESTHVGGVYAAGMSYGSRELMERHLLSLYFMLPLIGVCAGFLYHNWYPARVFPGDTLCYFTGMAFAVVGILGHFSKTLLLFFIPQIFNFLLSCPQIFGIIPCPRHRVPRLDEKPASTLLHPSRVQFVDPPSKLATAILKVLSVLRLTDLCYDNETGSIKSATNLTLPNVILVMAGPMKEPHITLAVAVIQIAGSCLAFTIRYGLSGLFYDGDRR
ncbi:tunicamycin resistance protein [Tulasnella sp. UAMH 9824]|nr:tunicamycin resistance protein [Tulasnella sp. UAMH 9824]